jgi:hypothetical protein
MSLICLIWFKNQPKINAFLGFFCLTVSALHCANAPKNTPINIAEQHDTITVAELAQLRDGDIILRAGFGMVSEHILDILHEPIPLTHCAVFYHTPPGDSVISSESRSLQDIDGVQIEPLTMFERDAQPHTIMAVRAHGTAAQARQLLACAKYYAARHIPFDYNFEMRDSTTFYCAELLQHCLQHTYKTDILTENIGANKPVLTLQQFYDPKKFDIVFRHTAK